ncbi:SIR2 family NAD-dependent protein deacylase [Taibaiella helva]|uniref:SIR2 family NAD-dependent protein deacylase n=1 Tax=Taibaiella helva TaxID=2301235 RepID=UPI000E574A64|nr:Sir2 family NAD-dependent protein deacetylase [Taibaiella helva]
MKPKLVVLTGAGISAESGLRTFRDSDGLWENYRVEDVATPRAWKKDMDLVLRFYNERRRDVLAAQPNAAHLGLAGLEACYNVHIVTQNIDDLHERAGSSKVLHLHGEILTMRSERDASIIYEIRTDIQRGDLAPDGAQLRPNIVWFEEEVPMINHAIPLMQEADIFVLVGSSLAVYPAAGLLQFVPPGAPKYILDKVIPEVRYNNVIPIEKPATEGIAELLRLLM